MDGPSIFFFFLFPAITTVFRVILKFNFGFAQHNTTTGFLSWLLLCCWLISWFHRFHRSDLWSSLAFLWSSGFFRIVSFFGVPWIWRHDPDVKIGKKFERAYRYIDRGFSPGTGMSWQKSNTSDPNDQNTPAALAVSRCWLFVLTWGPPVFASISAHGSTNELLKGCQNVYLYV